MIRWLINRIRRRKKWEAMNPKYLNNLTFEQMVRWDIGKSFKELELVIKE